MPPKPKPKPQPQPQSSAPPCAQSTSKPTTLPPTSSTSFITLRISPSKHRHLKESLERKGTVVPLDPTKPDPRTPFITLRYRPAHDQQEFVAVQRDQDQDSAIDVATPTGQTDSTSQDPSYRVVGAVPVIHAQRSFAVVATKQDSKHYAGTDDGTKGIVQPDVSLSVVTKINSAAIKGDQVPQEAPIEGSSREISARPQPVSLDISGFVTAETAFHKREWNHGDSIISNTTLPKYNTRSQSATLDPPAPPARKSVLPRSKLPPGWRLDENMQAVQDPNDVSGILKGVVDDLYDVQSKTHGFIPETQNLLIDKIGDISDKLARLKDVTDPQVTPSNPVHNVRIAPEIVDYVDEGRNPDIFTREFVENVQRGNAVINGKKQGLRDFSVILAQKMKEGIGGIDRQVDQIMKNAGLEKELAEAEKKAKEARKASGTGSENGAM